jgi:Tfp pilus assembly protein PilN
MTSQPDQRTAEAFAVSQVDWAPVPRVNLLPEEILAARGFRRVQFRLVFAVVVTIVLAAGGVAWAQLQVQSAQDLLDMTASRTVVLRQQEARYSEVPRVTAAVASAKAAREAALAQDLLWYRLMSDIALATPSNVWLNTMNVSLATAGTATGAGTDPLAPAGIGKVVVTGTANDPPDVAAWLEAIVRVRGLDGSTLQNLTRSTTAEGSEGSGGSGAAGAAGGSGGQLQFTSQIVIVNDALSHRYDRKAG